MVWDGGLKELEETGLDAVFGGGGGLVHAEVFLDEGPEGQDLRRRLPYILEVVHEEAAGQFVSVDGVGFLGLAELAAEVHGVDDGAFDVGCEEGDDCPGVEGGFDGGFRPAGEGFGEVDDVVTGGGDGAIGELYPVFIEDTVFDNGLVNIEADKVAAMFTSEMFEICHKTPLN